jgi:dTDP-4-amino-4,6-dideoxygalactose transaminase
MKSKIWLSSPHMGGEEKQFVNEAFDTNWIAPLGPNVDGFENDLKGYLGLGNVAALSSGTSAIHLALVMLGITSGDEVIASTFTFSATVNPIVYQGAKPVLVDSESSTWNMSPALLRKAVEERIKAGKKPKAIILVHLYGMPAKIDELLEIAHEFSIPVIEDAAEALGSTYRGQKCGTFGLFGILSFNGNKIITTSGGGALVCRTTEEAVQARFLSTQSRDAAPHYQHTQIGYNYRMSNVVAGIGRGQMLVLDKHIANRRRNNQLYRDFIVNKPGIRILVEPSPDFYSNHWLSAIVVDPAITGFTREDLRLAFDSENIETRPLWKPMHLQPVFSDCLSFVDGTSEQLFEQGLCLPSGSNLIQEDFDRIFAVLDRFL